ncbi:MAG TPA: protease modulator HflC, partial [Gemmataceae bacterium]|nr:protease modulator HflC [Gemmataceae bacterium]
SVLLLIVLVTLFLSTFTVDRTELVYTTQFGKLVGVYDGAKDAGLHWRWPWPVQSVQRLDRRLQVFDLPEIELLTRDDKGETIDKTITVDAYVCWRIDGEEGVSRFIRAISTADRAREILRPRIISRLGAEISNMKMDDLISVVSPEEAHGRMETLHDRLLGNSGADQHHADASSLQAGDLRDQARRDYGIELVDVRLRRTSHPAEVRDAIFARIRSERAKKVADYQGQGALLASKIKSEAELEARNILTDAKAAEQQIKGKADAEADRIRNLAHSQDPEFYAFLKKLEEYQRILGDNKSVLLLSSHRDMFDLLFKPPKPEKESGIRGHESGLRSQESEVRGQQ